MFSCCCCFYICIIEHIERYLSPVCAVCCSFKVRKLSDKMTYLNKTNLLTNDHNQLISVSVIELLFSGCAGLIT